MTAICRCEHCDAGYRVDEDRLGHSVQCKRCEKEFTLKRSDKDTHLSGGGGDTASPLASRAEAVPRRLGRFEIRARLGAGGFGTVYRAHDPLLDREVALKVPHAGRVQSAEDRARMLREAKASARLHHPNIVTVYEAGTEGDLFYIASAFVEGQTLEQVISQDRPDFRAAARVVMNLAGALDYAHRHGIIHRDVKPANVMVDAEGEPLLTDFGLARLSGELDRAATADATESAVPASDGKSQDENLTREGAVLGTPAYMSPEQARGDQEQVSPASDQYSLGAVLYHLLCGQRPFRGVAGAVIAMVIHREPTRPRELNSDVSRDLEAICLKAMAKSPDQRYTDCGALADDLRRWSDGEPVDARPVGGVERFVRWCRRNPVVSGLAAAAAMLLVLVTLVTTVGYVRTTRALDLADTERHRAEDALEKEETARKRETEALAEAKQAAEEAKQAAEKEAAERQNAQDATQREVAQRELAEKALSQEAASRQAAENSLYASRFVLAQHNWMAGDEGQARELLDACPAKLRGWEWGYLQRQFQSELYTVSAPFEQESFSADYRVTANIGAMSPTCTDLAFTPNGRQIVMAYAAATRSKEEEEVLNPGHYLIVDAADGRALGAWRNEASPGVPGLGNQVTLSSEIQLRTTAPAVKVALSSNGEHFALVSGTVRHGRFNRAGSPVMGPPLGAGFDGTVTDVIFLPDRQWLAVSGGDNQILAYAYGLDMAGPRRSAGKHDGRLLFRPKTPPGHTGRINSLACDPNGAFLVSGSEDNTLKIWELPAGKERRTLDEHRGAVTCVAVAPDGKQLASSSEDGTVKIWVASERESRMTIPAHATGVSSVAFDHDGGRIVTGSRDRLAKIWDATTGEQLETLRGHADRINSVAFSPDGRRVATASRDGTMKVWPSTSNTDALVVRSDELATGLAFSPDSKLVAAGLRDSTVTVWEVTTGQQAYRLGVPIEGMTDTSMSLTFSPDGQRVGAIFKGDVPEDGGPDARRLGRHGIRVWALDRGSLLVDTADNQVVFHSSVAFSPDGKWIASANDLVVWPAEASEAIGELPESLQPWLYVNDTVPDIIRDPLGQVPGRASSIAVFGPLSEAKTIRETQLANESHQGLFRIYCRDGAAGAIWKQHTPDSDAREVPTRRSRYDAVEKNELAATAPTAPVATIALDPGGTRLATGDLAGLIQLWDLTTGKLLAEAAGHTDPVNSLAFSPDGKRIVSGSADGTVKLWDSTSGLLLLTLTGHTDAVTSVAFSPDGTRIASGSHDKTIRVWSGMPL